jgi:hypothetical protein
MEGMFFDSSEEITPELRIYDGLISVEDTEEAIGIYRKYVEGGMSADKAVREVLKEINGPWIEIEVDQASEPQSS